MIQIGNKTYLNLEEQVEKNKDDISYLMEHGSGGGGVDVTMMSAALVSLDCILDAFSHVAWEDDDGEEWIAPIQTANDILREMIATEGGVYQIADKLYVINGVTVNQSGEVISL